VSGPSGAGADGTPTAPVPATLRAGVARGRVLFNRADFWASHEALETAWRAAVPPARRTVQGLILAAAAFHKYIVHDNPRGAARLIEGALARLDGATGTDVGIALEPLCAELRAWQLRIARTPADDGTIVGLPRLEWAERGVDGPIVLDGACVHLVECGGSRAALVAVSAGGITGWGECRMPWGTYGLWDALVEALLPGLLAEPVAMPSEFAVIWSDVVRDGAAIAGVEAALWDLWSRRQGLPIAEALGHGARPVPLAGRVREGDPQLVAAQMAALLGDGYRQIIVPARPNADRRVLPDLVGGTGVPFALDLGGAYRTADVSALKVLDGLGAAFLAQPVPSADLAQAIRLRRWLSTPVSLGGWPGARGLRSALDLGALDVVQLDPGITGLTEAVQIALDCGERGIPLWVSSSAVTPFGALADLALAAHPHAGLPADLSAALDATGAPFIRPDADGTARPSLATGLGLAPDAAWLDAVTVRRRELRA
jgi:o-succinylbenzoate synthase